MVATNAAGARSVRAGSVRRWVTGVEMITADGEIGWFGRAGPSNAGARGRGRRTPVPGQERWHNPFVAVRARFDIKARLAIAKAREEIATRFPRTTKNSAGYALNEYLRTGDLLDLIIGSEGTLGIITRVALALEPVPGHVSSALLALEELAALPEIVARLLELEASAIELMDRTLLALAAPRIPFPVAGVEAVLLVDFERGHPAAAEDAVAKARSALASRCARFESAITPDDRERLWAVRHAASPTLAALPPGRRSLQIVEDGCVPIKALGRYLAGVRAAAARHRVEVVAFGHAGDGHLHVNALTDVGDGDFEQRLSGLLDEVTTLVTDLKGTPSGEHGDGRMRAPVLRRVYGNKVLALFADVKRAFDPKGIFNPGVILPTAQADSLRHLKVGPGAESIPGDIEQRLRDLEQRGAWDVPKTELASSR
jgi:FAD/FMN-containing dehydrogenase